MGEQLYFNIGITRAENIVTRLIKGIRYSWIKFSCQQCGSQYKIPKEDVPFRQPCDLCYNILQVHWYYRVKGTPTIAENPKGTSGGIIWEF